MRTKKNYKLLVDLILSRCLKCVHYYVVFFYIVIFKHSFSYVVSNLFSKSPAAIWFEKSKALRE